MDNFFSLESQLLKYFILNPKNSDTKTKTLEYNSAAIEKQ